MAASGFKEWWVGWPVVGFGALVLLGSATLLPFPYNRRGVVVGFVLFVIGSLLRSIGVNKDDKTP